MPSRSRSTAARTFVILAIPAVVLLMWTCAWITDLKVWQRQSIPLVPLYPTRLLLIAASAALLVGAFVIGVLRANWSNAWKRAFTVALGAALTLLFLEGAFMFVPKNHNVGYTLASVVWHRAFWGPINTLGYRDAEHVRAPGKRVVLAVGDSFTAGDGLASVSQRWTDMLAQRRPDLQVLNVGRCGADSADEWDMLRSHPVPPDVLVLQYYPNDIEGAMKRAGPGVPAFTPYDDLPASPVGECVRGSYFFNFVYWQFPHADIRAYGQCLQSALHDEKVIASHLEELDRFCTFASERKIPLVVVLFPLLEDVEGSRDLLTRVKALFEAKQARVVDVTELVQDLDVARRTVNAQDSHASPLVNERVANALAEVLPR